MRRAVLAGLLCAAPLVAATAQASTGIVEREQLRAALRLKPHAAGAGVVPLPLLERPRASASATGGELAHIARSDAPARLLVGVRAHEDMDAVAAVLRALGATPERLDLTGVIAAAVPSGAAAVPALRADPRVAYVEPDPAVVVAVDEFDRLDPDTGIKFTWAYDTVRAGEAIAAVGGGSSRLVAVVDTGLDVNHPEFAGQIKRTVDTSTGHADVTDFVGHGTFVTGLIAALNDNGLGGRGVAGRTKILAVRASRDTEGRFFLSDMLAGIDIAIRGRARIVNMSLAGTSFSRSQVRALELAFLNDVLPVAAAGNHGDSGNPLEFPAALVGGPRGGRGIGLSVGATMPNGAAASFSTHNRFVSLAAPGASAGDCRFGVFSTLPATTATPWTTPDGCDETITGVDGSRYAYGEGTSFAAPIVSGLAALAWQAEPRLASEQVGEVLTRSAAGNGWNQFTGAGVADGMHAVEIARVYDVVPPRSRARVHRHGNRVRVHVRRTRDRTTRGDELAGHVQFGLLVSRDGGRSFDILASRRNRAFTKDVRIRGRRANVLVSTACDANGNCGVKRLGRFRRHR
ncbi:MAG TPA: S8 family serine peptidase [Thermoleophilaceae bacterium]